MEQPSRKCGVVGKKAHERTLLGGSSLLGAGFIARMVSVHGPRLQSPLQNIVHSQSMQGVSIGAWSSRSAPIPSIRTSGARVWVVERCEAGFLPVFHEAHAPVLQKALAMTFETAHGMSEGSENRERCCFASADPSWIEAWRGGAMS